MDNDIDFIASMLTDDPNLVRSMQEAATHPDELTQEDSLIDAAKVLDILHILQSELQKIGVQLQKRAQNLPKFNVSYGTKEVDITGIQVVPPEDHLKIIEKIEQNAADNEVYAEYVGDARRDVDKYPTFYALLAVQPEMLERVKTDLGFNYGAVRSGQSDKMIVSMSMPSAEDRAEETQQADAGVPQRNDPMAGDERVDAHDAAMGQPDLAAPEEGDLDIDLNMPAGAPMGAPEAPEEEAALAPAPEDPAAPVAPEEAEEVEEESPDTWSPGGKVAGKISPSRVQAASRNRDRDQAIIEFHKRLDKRPNN